MKNNFLFSKSVGGVLAFLISFVFFVHVVHAQTLTTTDLGLNDQIQTNLGTGSADIRLVVANIIRTALGLLGIVALGIILYGGFVWMTAGGNEEKIATAKKVLRNGIIGLAIILSAYGITSFIISKLVDATGGSSVGGSGGTGGGGGGGPFFSDSFYVSSLPPSMQLCVRNAKLSVVFNKEVDIDTVSSNVAVLDMVNSANPVTTTGAWTYGSNKNTVLFTPEGSCGADPGNDCFKSKNAYLLRFVGPTNIKTLNKDPELSLDCRARSGCGPVDFVSGETVNRSNPTISFDAPEPGSVFGVGDVVPVTLSYQSGSGLQSAVIYVQDASGQRISVDSFSGTSCSAAGTVPMQWNTGGFTAGAYTLQAVGTNFAGLSDTKSQSVSLKPSHCVNGVLDNGTNGTSNLGEEQLGPPECGGECGACSGGSCTTNSDCSSGICQNGVCKATLTIRDYSPRSGAPGTYVSIFGSNFGSTPGHVYFTDGVTQPASTNLVENASFETGETGWAAYTNGVIERTTESSYVGKYSLKLTSALTGNPGGFYFPRAYYTFSNAVEGKTYTISVWVKRTAGGPIPGLVVKTFLKVAVNGQSERQFRSDGIDTDSWQRLKLSITIQPDEKNIVYIQPGINFGTNQGQNPGGQAIYIDAVQMEEGAVATPYIDGSLGPGYSWNGTPNASASSRAAGVGSLIEAQLAPCGTSNTSWKGNQIIIQVPEGMSAAQGVIKVVGAPTATDPAGQTDTTANHQLPNFTLSSVVHPGICAISPAEAVAGSLVAVAGDNFGATKTSADSVLLSGVKASIASKNGNIAWQDTNITAAVPGLIPGAAALKVVNDGVDSNSVRFVVDDGVVAGSPIIESVTPSNGPAGEYITIVGKNFGENTGQVWFKILPSDNAIIGDFTFPAACAKAVWHDGQVIVKFPKSLGVVNASYAVQAVTADNKVSAFNTSFSYRLTSGTPSPGICALSPNAGPIPLPNNGKVQVIGEYLLDGNTVADPVQALFWSLGSVNVASADGRISASVQNTIRQAGIDTLTVVPAVGTVSGPVSVYRSSDKKISNGVNFTVGDCSAAGATCGVGSHCCAAGEQKGVCQPDGVLCTGEKKAAGFVWKFSTKDIPPTPHVVESCSDNAVTLPTPAPSTQWNTSDNFDAEKVCRQALVTVEFDAALDKNSVNASTVEVNRCDDVTKVDGCVNQVAVQLMPGSYTLVEAQSSANSRHQSLSLQPASSWQDATWYQVVLKKGITSDGASNSVIIPLAADKPCGGDSAYCFYFKSGSQDCALKNVLITPYSYWTNVLESPMKKPPHTGTSDAVEYRGNGLSDQRCIMMNMDGWNWQWASADVQYASINGPSVNAVAHVNALANTVGINLANDAVSIQATATKNGIAKQNTSPLTIDLSNPQVVNYWPQCQEACTNAEVAVQFNMGLSSRNLTNPSTVRLLKCYDDNCAKTDDVTYTANVKLDVAPPYATIKIANNGGAAVVHKGPNLVTNGFADSRTNANFTDQSYSSETHGGAGSFTYSKPAFYSFTNDVIPVDPTKTYYVEGWAKSGNNDGTNYNPINRQHMGVAPVDVDGKLIDAIHTLKVGGSANTRLTADLNPGDTEVHLADVTGWQNGEPNYQRQMMWYGYRDSKGNLYPDYQYTRNTTFDFSANGTWTYRTLGTWAVGGINLATKTITLTSKWPGPAVKAGTAVSNASAGAVYRYLPNSGQNISKTWTKFSGTIGGYDTWMDGTNYYTTFPYGTAGVKIMFINNYGMVATDAPNTIHWSDIQFYDTSAYTPVSNNALEPNTLYKVLVSNANPNPKLSTNNIWSRSKAADATSFGKPYNEQFSWRFKTKTTSCEIDRVEVNPLNYNAASVKERALYAAVPYSSPDSCSAVGQKLNPFDVSWNWHSSDAQVATINAFSTKGYSPYCTAACVAKGSKIASSQYVVQAVCGNGVIEAGEDCDKPDANANCGLDCRKITGRNTGSYQKPDAKDTSLSTCGSGQIGAGEDCDLGITASVSDPKSSLNCSASCLHTGTALTSKWCYENRIARGGFSVAEYTAACASAVSMCGNGVTEPEEDAGCDLGSGKHASWCDDNCLVVKADTANTNPICSTSDEGCAKDGYHYGSSLEYSVPSVCGDGLVGFGEDAFCEQNDTFVITNSNNLLNPWALAIGVGTAIPSGDPLSQKTTISAATVATTGNKEGSGTFTITCGYTSENECSSIDESLGLAANSCCYARAVLGDTIPANGETSVCRNTAIQANFNGLIDEKTLPGNLLIAYNNETKKCGYDSGFCQISGASCVVNADCTTAGDSCIGAAKVFDDSFESGTVRSEWSSQTPGDALSIITSPNNSQHFLGTDPLYGFVNTTASAGPDATGAHTNPTLTLSNLPSHTAVTVQFDVYALNSWDGNGLPGPYTDGNTYGPDYWQLDADGVAVYRTNFLNVDNTSMYATVFPTAAPQSQAYPDQAPPGGNHKMLTGATAFGALGYPNRPPAPAATTWYGDVTYHIIVTIPHTSGNLKLDFKGLQDQMGYDESWGLDNVKVYVEGGTNALNVDMKDGNVWCAGSAVGAASLSNPSANTSRIDVALSTALKRNTEYAVVLTNGVKDVRGVSVPADSYWKFTTGKDVCEIKSVTLDPSKWYFSRANDTRTLLATVNSTHNATLQPVPGLYSWQYVWRPTTSPFVALSDVSTPDNIATAKNQNGEVDGRVYVKLTENKVSTATGTVATAASHFTVFLCENPWPPKEAAVAGPSMGRRTTIDGSTNNTSIVSNSPFPYADAPDNHSGFDLVSGVFNGTTIPRTSAAIGDGYFNFSTYYCADKGGYGTADDYPYLRPAVQTDATKLAGAHGICETTGKSCDVDTDCNADGSLRCINNSPFKRFIFSNDKNGDAIGIQILPNVKHLTPAEWYGAAKNAGGSGFGGTMQQVTVSGYDAVSDGNNIYVAALNVAGDLENAPSLYDVIYQFSINANADSDTRHVFEELIKNLRFNTNLTHNDGYCGTNMQSPLFATKCTSDLDCASGQVCVNQVEKLQRNFGRLRSLQVIDSVLYDYYLSHGNVYPALGEGTYLAGQSVSTWPSWNSFGNVVGRALPVDPVNQLATAGTCKVATNKFCTIDSDCGSSDTCVLHDKNTGWSAVDRRFSFACAVASYAYRYKVEDKGKSFTVYNRFEDLGFNPVNLGNFIKGFGFTNLGYFARISNDWTSLGNLNGICTGVNEISTLNQGTCGDGVVNANQGEECDPVGSKQYDNVPACAQNGATVQTCTNDCKWGSAVQVACKDIINFKCGNGRIDPGETCDEGALNGTYNHCSTKCDGLVATYSATSPGYCGDSVVNPKFEVCDKGGSNGVAIKQCVVDGAIKNKTCTSAADCSSLLPPPVCTETQTQFCVNTPKKVCNIGGVDTATTCNTDANCSAPKTCSVDGLQTTKSCSADKDCWSFAATTSFLPLSISGTKFSLSPNTYTIVGNVSCNFNLYYPLPQTQILYACSANFIPADQGMTEKRFWLYFNCDLSTGICTATNVGLSTNAPADMAFDNNPAIVSPVTFSLPNTLKCVGSTQASCVTRDVKKCSNGTSCSVDTDCGAPEKICTPVGTASCDVVAQSGDRYGVTKEASCSWDCQSYGPYCGDKIVNGPEECDGDEACQINGQPGTKKCNANCTFKKEADNSVACVPNSSGTPVSTASGSCGNGVTEANEACDSGLLNGITCNPTYGNACSYCAVGCKNVITVQPKEFCGDSVFQSNEVCEVINNKLFDAPGHEATLCSAEKNTKVNLDTAKTGVSASTLMTYKKGGKSCSATCSFIVDGCVECGLDQKNGKQVSGSIINVLDGSATGGVSSMDLYFSPVGRLAVTGDLSAYRVAYASLTVPAGTSVLPTFSFKAAPVPTDAKLVQDARLVSNAVCFTTTTPTDSYYQVVLNNDVAKAFALPIKAVSEPYNLIVSPRITNSSYVRIVVSWKNSNGLVGGFVKDPGFASLLESKDWNSNEYASGANYTLAPKKNGVWYHGAKGNAALAEESFTVDTSALDNGTYQFFVRTVDKTPIENLRAAGDVRVDVYGPEGGTSAFSFPVKSFNLSQAGRSENGTAAYWYVFSLAKNSTNITSVTTVDPTTQKVTTYQNGRVATDPTKF